MQSIYRKLGLIWEVIQFRLRYCWLKSALRVFAENILQNAQPVSKHFRFLRIDIWPSSLFLLPDQKEITYIFFYYHHLTGMNFH